MPKEDTSVYFNSRDYDRACQRALELRLNRFLKIKQSEKPKLEVVKKICDVCGHIYTNIICYSCVSKKGWKARRKNTAENPH